MKVSIPAVIGTLIVYLVLAIGTDPNNIWAFEEIIAGLVCGILVGLFVGSTTPKIKKRPSMANPVRWIKAFVFLFVLFGGMAKANLDVAYRVITGKIRPGIVKIDPNYKSDLSAAILANSITLTPGTLSVDIDEESNQLYIHWINVSESAVEQIKKEGKCDPEHVSGSFSKKIRGIAE